jgi:hypothetical protein
LGGKKREEKNQKAWDFAGGCQLDFHVGEGRTEAAKEGLA